MPKVRQGASLLAVVFWCAFCAGSLVILVPTLDEMAHPQGQFSGLAVIMGLLLVGILAASAIVVALIRKPWGYAAGLVLVSAPLLWWAMGSVRDQVQRGAAPSPAEQEAGRGYFNAPADRALAEAMIAKDAVRVAELARAANLEAKGWDGMTFMRLAMERTGTDLGIVGALLRAGLDPDQDAGMLYARIQRERDAPLLRCVIDSGVDLGKHMGRGQWFLYARYDWPEGLALMLDHGVDTEAQDAMGYTEIMRATRSGSWPTVEALLAHGARTDRRGNDGQSLRDLLTKAIAEPHGALPARIVALDESLH